MYYSVPFSCCDIWTSHVFVVLPKFNFKLKARINKRKIIEKNQQFIVLEIKDCRNEGKNRVSGRSHND